MVLTLYTGSQAWPSHTTYEFPDSAYRAAAAVLRVATAATVLAIAISFVCACYSCARIPATAFISARSPGGVAC